MINNHKLKILIFTEGTILMHKNAKGKARKEIMSQVQKNEQSVHDYSSYIPIGEAAKKITAWKNQGAEIIYLTSRIRRDEISDI